jgi:hypothetical protein
MMIASVCFHSVSVVMQPVGQGVIAYMNLHCQAGLRTVADEAEEHTVFPFPAMRPYRGSKYIVPLIINFGTG